MTTNLTRSELKLLHCLAAGHNYREIGKRIFKSERTIEVQVAHIRSKLGARNNANLIHIAYQNRLLIIEQTIHNG